MSRMWPTLGKVGVGKRPTLEACKSKANFLCHQKVEVKLELYILSKVGKLKVGVAIFQNVKVGKVGAGQVQSWES